MMSNSLYKYKMTIKIKYETDPILIDNGYEHAYEVTRLEQQIERKISYSLIDSDFLKFN
jgi:hypothetical protein